ncbi:tRNA (guanosine(37)-N1)-methyltransferase TrmD [Candidatus Daviesbacteria bacterium]|nr:tRNA (guanosine(37)-N1)-methyltransferase TrmD [Candidatus Daviesbacteria bacterium]
MRISIITLFPEVFEPILNSSILKRAQNKGLVEFELINLRPFGEGKHQVVDDRPYGGGAGMVLKANVLAKALKSVYRFPATGYRKSRRQKTIDRSQIVLTSASGAQYKQSKAREFSNSGHLIIVCGHYEGIDQRFIDKYVDEEISIGDYVLTGGEIPAMVIVDSITRLIPGVLEKPEAVEEESFSITYNLQPTTLLEYPHYTRPEEFEGEKVPEILLSGNHAQIKKWQTQKSLEKTKKIRPDLLKSLTQKG